MTPQEVIREALGDSLKRMWHRHDLSSYDLTAVVPGCKYEDEILPLMLAFALEEKAAELRRLAYIEQGRQLEVT